MLPDPPSIDHWEIWENVPFRVCLKDVNGMFVYMNGRCRKDHRVSGPLGYIGTSDEDYFIGAHVLLRQREERAILFSGGQVSDHEEYETWKDGRRTWVSTTKRAVAGLDPRSAYLFCVVRDITQNKETTDHYTTSVELSGLGLWYHKYPTDDLWLSESWKKLLGYRDDEIPNARDEWTSRLHPSDEKRVLEAVDRHLRHETPIYECTYRLRHKNGFYRWIRARGRAEWDPDGNVTAFAGSDEDITERNGQARRILNTINGLVWIKDRDFRFVYVNQHLAALLGKSPDDVEGLRDEDLFHNQMEIAAFRSADSQVLKTRVPLQILEETVTLSDSRVRTFATVKMPFETESGELQILGLAVDTTDLIEARRTLDHERALVQRLINQLPEGIYYKDQHGRYLRCNQAFADLIELAADQIIGKTNEDVVSPHYLSKTRVEEEKVFEGQTIRRLRAASTSAGRVYRLVTKAPIRDSQTGAVTELCGIVQDVTDLVWKRRLLRPHFTTSSTCGLC